MPARSSACQCEALNSALLTKISVSLTVVYKRARLTARWRLVLWRAMTDHGRG